MILCESVRPAGNLRPKLTVHNEKLHTGRVHTDHDFTTFANIRCTKTFTVHDQSRSLQKLKSAVSFSSGRTSSTDLNCVLQFLYLLFLAGSCPVASKCLLTSSSCTEGRQGWYLLYSMVYSPLPWTHTHTRQHETLSQPPGLGFVGFTGNYCSLKRDYEGSCCCVFPS